MKKYTNKEIVEKFSGELYHFFIDEGWPIRIEKDHNLLCKVVPSLVIKNNSLVRNLEVNPDHDLIIELCRYRCNEIYEEYNKLHDELKRIVNKY